MGDTYCQKQKWKIGQEFQWIQDKCYLDHAGAALYSSTQIENVFANLKRHAYGNPHSHNDMSKNCSDIIDQVRHRVLSFFNTSENEYSIIFTSGATAAIKIVIENFAWEDECSKVPNDLEWYDTVQSRGYMVYTASNHTSILGCREVAAEQGTNILCLSDKQAEEILGDPTWRSHGHSSTLKSLFAYPAQCNFSGRKTPLSWIDRIQNGILNDRKELGGITSQWYCLLDAASYCATNPLDLKNINPDFVCVSFYKIFGYPTGLGALLVKKSSEHCLRKKYFGGGTVDIVLPMGRFYKLRDSFHERYEDGTIPYLSIISLHEGFDTMNRLDLSMEKISRHVFSLARIAFIRLQNLSHWNGEKLVEIYSDSDFTDIKTQGGIVTFNLRRSDGSYIGYIEVLHVANSYKIQLRTGCFCNIGACQRHLKISDKELLSNFHAGHVCGDERDLINGKPTGAVRISFGYSSSYRDIECLLNMLHETFLEKVPTHQISMEKPPETNHVRLENIRLYPVKSCGAMDVKSWSLTARGLHLDRQWMVVNSNGVCLTQKQEPRLCHILPTVDPCTEQLTLTFRGLDPIIIKKPIESQDFRAFNFCKNKVCGDSVEGEDCGDEVSDWLLRNLAQPGLRLIRQTNHDKRRSKINAIQNQSNEEAGQLSLVNQAQYLLINSRSSDYLQERLKDEENFNLGTLKDRFRANFIVSGNEAFEETKWEKIQIGKIIFKVEGSCTRCQMICIDQQTGEKNRKPLVELSRALEGKLRFGIYCSHINITGQHSKIEVGDFLTILSRKQNMENA